MSEKDTIAAIATGMTDSGIGIIRISGEDAVRTGDKIFRSKSGRHVLEHGESHRMYYGFVIDHENSQGAGFCSVGKDSESESQYGNKCSSENDSIIDEVMAVVMKRPRSFTGEDTVEIQCHGGIFVMKKILETVLKCGARLAEPGEFTKRAFLNGRIDLSRAEAVMDVIQSKNEYALFSSVNQLKGALSQEVKQMRGEILYEIAFIESALDDPEHISLDSYPEKLLKKTEDLLQKINGLIHTAENGRWIKEGIQTVIVGKPNAGKSSFLNCLLGEERAIVTDVAGTTRDILTENIMLGGISLNVVDTAGIRDTDDTVEKIGVEKARKYAEDADLIVYVVDTSVELDENDREIINFIRDKKVIVLLNKSDLCSRVEEEDIRKAFYGNKLSGEVYYNSKCKEIKDMIIDEDNMNRNYVSLKISARDGSGMSEFEECIKKMFFHGEIKSSNEIIITNMRHKEALQEAFESLKLVKQSIEDGMPEDFYSIDLMSAYASLGRIIGEEVDDDLVEEIFSKFCMGK